MSGGTILSPPPPPPRWLRLLFALGPILTGAMLWKTQGARAAPFLGFVCAGLLTGGLALASQFFEGTPARAFGGLAFTGLIMVGFWAIIYVGCKCTGSI